MTDRSEVGPRPSEYIDAVDPVLHYTAPRWGARQRVRAKLPRARGFCPLIRQAERLEAFAPRPGDQRCRDMLTARSRTTSPQSKPRSFKLCR